MDGRILRKWSIERDRTSSLIGVVCRLVWRESLDEMDGWIESLNRLHRITSARIAEDVGGRLSTPSKTDKQEEKEEEVEQEK